MHLSFPFPFKFIQLFFMSCSFSRFVYAVFVPTKKGRAVGRNSIYTIICDLYHKMSINESYFTCIQAFA